jgi:hypothetical protein
MAITEETRYRLHQRLTEVLGEDEAATLMEHLPPVGWADVTTKRDLDHLQVLRAADLDRLRLELDAGMASLRSDLGAEIASVRSDLGAEIASVRSDLGAEIASVRSDLGAEIASVRSDLGGRIDHLRAETQRDLRVMSMAIVGANTALVAAVVAVLRFV